MADVFPLPAGTPGGGTAVGSCKVASAVNLRVGVVIGGDAGRLQMCHDLLDAIASHRVGDRPDRYELWLKKAEAQLQRLAD